MFICPFCKTEYELPYCLNCGYTPGCIDDIWQMTDDPDIVTDGDGDKYIGYEYIGEAYSGAQKYVLGYPDGLFAKEISRITGNGVFFDLGCGDGCFTVPAAQNGTKIIAADISNKMLKILKNRANRNDISLKNVTLCRMNALNLSLADNAVDCVVSNSVLHLISRPEKVVREIHRVLKPGGCFIVKDDRPGNTPGTPYDNSEYNIIVDELYGMYWKQLEQKGVNPTKYGWNFDRESLCAELFAEKNEIVLPVQTEFIEKLKVGFLPRFLGKGFSDQVDVPVELHDETVYEVIGQIKEKYGNDFDELAFHGIEPDIVMTVYKK